MSLRDHAAREAILKALYDAIGDELKACRADVQAGLDEAQETSGTRQIVATLPDGTVVAKISLTEPKPEARVTDEAAFTAWAVKAYPSEIKREYVGVVTSVQPAFTTRLLGQMTAAGVPCDPDTGELVPGVEIRATRGRSHSVRFEKTGREDVGEAWRRGELAHVVLPELAPGGTS